MMKFGSYTGVIGLLLALSIGSQAADRSWKGWITDSRCGAAGAHPGDKECAKSSVKRGAKFVLVDDSNKTVYVLDRQDKVALHAGEHVEMERTVDGHTLKVISIRPTIKPQRSHDCQWIVCSG